MSDMPSLAPLDFAAVREQCIEANYTKQQERIEANESLRTYTHSEFSSQELLIAGYFQHLENFHQFQLDHFPDNKNLLIFLCSREAYQAAMEREYWIDCKVDYAQWQARYDVNTIPSAADQFSALLIVLSKLKAYITSHSESHLTTPLKEVWLNSILLLESFVKNRCGRREEKVSIADTNSKVEALQQILLLTVDCVQGMVVAPAVFTAANKKMLDTIDPSASFHDNRLYVGLLSAVATVICTVAVITLATAAAPLPLIILLGAIDAISASGLTATILNGPTQEQQLAKKVHKSLRNNFFSSAPDSPPASTPTPAPTDTTRRGGISYSGSRMV
jgi:hypothetical protein